MILTVICNYNAGKKFDDCINSVVKYGICNSIAVFDNGSTEDIKKSGYDANSICERYGITNLRIPSDYGHTERNIGKARGLNHLVDEFGKNNKIILSIDSDITLTNPDFYKTLITVDKYIGEKVSCFIGNLGKTYVSKRNWNWRDVKLDDNMSFRYFVPEEGYGCGIAGGCIAVRYDHWKTIGGYVTKNGLYGGNDGNMMLNLHQKTKLPICVIKEMSVYHPEETDKGYMKWKKKAHDDQINYGKCLTQKGYYDEKV